MAHQGSLESCIGTALFFVPEIDKSFIQNRLNMNQSGLSLERDDRSLRCLDPSGRLSFLLLACVESKMNVNCQH